MKTHISNTKAKDEYGISIENEIMQNGEIRFRLISTDGSSYIRTEAAYDGWQTAHYHKGGQEVYVVQNKWMAMATLSNRKMVVQRYPVGSIVVIKRDKRHNVFLPAEAVIHTVKFGKTKINDWKEAKVLSRMTSKVTLEQLLKLQFTGSNMGGTKSEK